MIALRLAVLAALAAAATAAAAQSNFTFLKDAPIQKMTRADTDLMMKTWNQALDRNADGGMSGWTNPQTGASGTVTPLRTFTQKGMKCRETEYTNHAGGFNGAGKFTLCRQRDGAWKIAS